MTGVHCARGSVRFVAEYTTYCPLGPPPNPVTVRFMPDKLKLWMDKGGAVTVKRFVARAIPGIGLLSVKSLLVEPTITWYVPGRPLPLFVMDSVKAAVPPPAAGEAFAGLKPAVTLIVSGPMTVTPLEIASTRIVLRLVSVTVTVTMPATPPTTVSAAGVTLLIVNFLNTVKFNV